MNNDENSWMPVPPSGPGRLRALLANIGEDQKKLTENTLKDTFLKLQKNGPLVRRHNVRSRRCKRTSAHGDRPSTTWNGLRGNTRC